MHLERPGDSRDDRQRGAELVGHGRDHRRLPHREIPFLLRQLELAFAPGDDALDERGRHQPRNRKTTPRPIHSVERWGMLPAVIGHNGPASNVATAEATTAPR